jgi:hypothetical protein
LIIDAPTLSSEYNFSFVTLTLLIHGVTPRKLLMCHLTLDIPLMNVSHKWYIQFENLSFECFCCLFLIPMLFLSGRGFAQILQVHSHIIQYLHFCNLSDIYIYYRRWVYRIASGESYVRSILEN